MILLYGKATNPKENLVCAIDENGTIDSDGAARCPQQQINTHSEGGALSDFHY